MAFALARALWEKGERERAVELARGARKAFQAPKQVAEAEAWLSARR